jgi:hypothetical protein
MMPAPVLDTQSNTHRLRWLLPDSATACLATPDCCAITTKRHKISSLKTPAARSCFNLRSAYAANPVSLPLRVIIGAPELVAKSHSTRGTAAAHSPRFRALALFGRRPLERVDNPTIPASENLHNT